MKLLLLLLSRLYQTHFINNYNSLSAVNQISTRDARCFIEVCYLSYHFKSGHIVISAAKVYVLSCCGAGGESEQQHNQD